jgi:hypothetical protein
MYQEASEQPFKEKVTEECISYFDTLITEIGIVL